MSPRFTIKFSPGDKDSMPDLILWFDDKNMEENMGVLDELKRGSKIKFTGYTHNFNEKIQKKRRGESHFEDNYPHLKVKKIEVVGMDEKIRAAGPIKHDKGRYYASAG